MGKSIQPSVFSIRKGKSTAAPLLNTEYRILDTGKRAFTLMEVLVSIAILSIVGMALMQAGISSTGIIGHVEKKREIGRLATLAALHGKVDYHKTDRFLSDFLDGEYSISNDQIRRELKDRRVFYTQTVATTVEFGETNTTDAEGGSAPLVQFDIYKIRISEGDVGGFYYRLAGEQR